MRSKGHSCRGPHASHIGTMSIDPVAPHGGIIRRDRWGTGSERGPRTLSNQCDRCRTMSRYGARKHVHDMRKLMCKTACLNRVRPSASLVGGVRDELLRSSGNGDDGVAQPQVQWSSEGGCHNVLKGLRFGKPSDGVWSLLWRGWIPCDVTRCALRLKRDIMTAQGGTYRTESDPR
jgi:hypothetical protein